MAGPALVIPFTNRQTTISPDGQQITTDHPGNAIFLPQRIRAVGQVNSQVRRRGIFSVPVYRLNLSVEGEFGKLDFSQLGVDPATVSWDRAHLVVAISDVRAIQEQTSVEWNGQRTTFLPGTGNFGEYKTGIQAAVGAQAATEGYRFSFPLALNGSMGLSMAPFAETTVVELDSNSTNPSFQGNWLPTARTVDSDGIEARWSIQFLGRNYPQAWTDRSALRPAIEASLFGVELVEPVDTYSMADRSLKYAGLFLLLTFALVWLIEVLGGCGSTPSSTCCSAQRSACLPAGAVAFGTPGVLFGVRHRQPRRGRHGGGVQLGDIPPTDPGGNRGRSGRGFVRLFVRAAQERGLCAADGFRRSIRHPGDHHVRHSAGGLVGAGDVFRNTAVIAGAFCHPLRLVFLHRIPNLVNVRLRA